MSNENSVSSVTTLPEALTAAANWPRQHRMAHLLCILIGGLFAIAIHLFGQVYLPMSLPRWFLYMALGDLSGLIRGAIFWFLMGLMIFSLVGYARSAGIKALGRGVATVPGRCRNMLQSGRRRPGQTLMLGLAAGFVCVTIFHQAPGIAIGGILPIPTALQSIILILILLFAFSRLPRLTARTLARSDGTSNPDDIGMFCVAFALPLLLTLPFAWFTMTTRIALLFALLGLLVWRAGLPGVRTAAAPLLIVTGLLLVITPETILAASFWDDSGAPPLATLLTKDQWLNAILAALPCAAGAAAGVSLGQALGQNEPAVAPPKVTAIPTSDPTPIL